MSDSPRYAALRTILELAEAGYFADFEVVDEAQAVGVSAKVAAETLGFAADVGLIVLPGPVRLSRYGREALASPALLDELAATLDGPAFESPIEEPSPILPRSLDEWRTFQHENPAAAAAVARGLMANTAEVFFRVRGGSEPVFASRFVRRLGRAPDPEFIRAGPAVTAQVAQGFVRWLGHGDVVGALLDLDVTQEDASWVIEGEIAWQLITEGWRPGPPQPIRQLEDRLGRLSPWFLAGIEMAQRNPC